MTSKEAVNWIINISADIGKAQHQDLWHYEQALSEIKDMLEAEPERPEQPESAWEYCAECDHNEMCRWYPYEGCEFRSLPSAEPEVIRCKDCRWWDRESEDSPIGYCHACKHGHYSRHWEISIRRTYEEDFFCADAEPKMYGEDEEEDD